MNAIKNYTLKYYCLGVAVKGNNYRVYLRYYVTMNGKTDSCNLNTTYTLTKEQVKFLNANDLGGQVQKEFDNIRANVVQIIEGLKFRYNSYPTPKQLKADMTDMQNVLPMEKYISDFLKTIETKKTSKYIYALRIKQFKAYYDLNLVKTPLQTLINENTIENYAKWLKELYKVKKNKKVLGKAYLYDLKSAAIRLLNYIAKQQKITPIAFYLKTPKVNEQYTPTDAEFEKLVTTDCEGNLRLVQDIIYINSFIGIRIEELLSIRPDNITFLPDHVEVHFPDFKHSKARTVVLMDAKATMILNKYMNGNKIFNISADTFNRHLKKLAEIVFKEKQVTLYDADNDEPITYYIRDIITSHCIRRYAIIANIDKYGIDVAKVFSGHTNYQTIERHYARDFMNIKALLNIMRKNANNKKI